MTEQAAPPLPPERAQWLYKHGAEIKSIAVDYVPTGVDTAKTVWHLEFHTGHKETIDLEGSLSDLLDFYPSHEVATWRAIASLKKRFVAMCEARAKWEKSNAAELAAYKRLKAKFEGSPNPTPDKP
jgi:hypothetical protein